MWKVLSQVLPPVPLYYLHSLVHGASLTDGGVLPPFLHLDVGCRLGGRRTHARSSNDNFSVVDDHRFSARNSFYDPSATTIQLTMALPMFHSDVQNA